jgi:type II secretion system protein G
MALRKEGGFTLIELLVVVAIVGLLATVATIAISGASKKARDNKRRADLRTMQKALDMYFQENGAYPTTAGAWWGACSVFGNHDVSGPNGFIPNLAPTYIGKLPVDPHPAVHTELNGACTLGHSCYIYNSNGTDYKLMADCDLESGPPTASDPMADPARPTQNIMVCNPLGAGCATW